MSKEQKRKRWRNNRQRLALDEVRSSVIRIRVSKKELAIIQLRASQMEMPLSTWAREALIARQLRASPVPEINRDIYRELTHIGRNINQMAKMANSGASLFSGGSLEDLERLLRKIKILLLGVVKNDS